MVFFLLLPLVILFGVVVVVIRWIDGYREAQRSTAGNCD
jgi:hypothetical protein